MPQPKIDPYLTAASVTVANFGYQYFNGGDYIQAFIESYMQAAAIAAMWFSVVTTYTLTPKGAHHGKM